MPGIRLKENEPFEVAIRRFKRTIEKAGTLTELRSREFYEKPTSERKRKLAAAVKRHHKRIRSQHAAAQALLSFLAACLSGTGSEPPRSMPRAVFVVSESGESP